MRSCIRAWMQARSRMAFMRIALLVGVLAFGCSSPSTALDAGPEGGDEPRPDAAVACPQRGMMSSGVLAGATSITGAAQADLDGDGRADLVVAGDTGLIAYLASACGA